MLVSTADFKIEISSKNDNGSRIDLEEGGDRIHAPTNAATCFHPASSLRVEKCLTNTRSATV
jgi:hypothetical protein